MTIHGEGSVLLNWLTQHKLRALVGAIFVYIHLDPQVLSIALT